jgi:hypothetical protein
MGVLLCSRIEIGAEGVPHGVVGLTVAIGV